MPFVVFEGLDGAGKSTLMGSLIQTLKDSGQEVVTTRDPGGTDLGDQIRELILSPEYKPCEKTELLLYQASRSELVDKVLRPALSRKAWVISDRYTSSTIAFQKYARGIDGEPIEWLNDYVTKEAQPDIFIYVDVTVETSRQRLGQRVLKGDGGMDRMEQEAIDFHERVRNGYLEQSKAANWIVLNGEQKPKEVLEQLVKHPKYKALLESV